MRDGTATKERIERAALRLFADKGFAETSIRDIAREAGISLGAMYNHYASKYELGWELFSMNYSAIGIELHHRAKGQPNLRKKLRSMIRYVFARFEEDKALVTFVFFVRHAFIRRVNSGSVRMANPYMVFRSVIVEAMRRGEIPENDPDLMTSLVIGAIIQPIDTKILDRIKPDLISLSDIVAKSCFQMLRA